MTQVVDLPLNPPEPINQPVRFKRDPDTGLVVGHTYKYTPDGRIDWRADVPTKYLYVANEYRDRVVKEQGKALSDIDILAVKDDWLRIRVGGINHLAHLRGVRSCVYPHMLTRDGYAGVSCEIEFIPNIESDMMPETWSSMASATLRSVDKQFTPYLETFAENRAFTRCVKRALQINILSDIEIGGDGRKDGDGTSTGVSEGDETSSSQSANGTSGPQGFEPRHRLEELCNTPPAPMKGAISFEALKLAAAQYAGELNSKPTEWTSFASIQPIDAYVLIGKIKEKAAAMGVSVPKKG